MSQNTTALLPVGTLLNSGNYRIERHLASGGFGNTYEATHLGLNERVAIKELYLKGICNRSADGNVTITISENKRLYSSQLAKFKKEALRLRKLNSRHIVRVLNYFEENGTAYYVMDYLKGESLSARMKRTGRPLTEQEVRYWLPQVLDALEESHAHSIWHLDLKPGNIMVNEEGEAVLIDFGASKQVSTNDSEGATTSTANCYTPGYAPSELTEGAVEKFGPFTDMYSLGATLYNLFTRQSPPSPSVVMEEGLPPYTVPVSDAMKKLIEWMMRYARTQRPQSVAEVRRYMEKHFGKEMPPKPEMGSDDMEVTEVNVEVVKKNEEADVKVEVVHREPVDTDVVQPDKPRRWWWPWGVVVAAAALLVGSVAFCTGGSVAEEQRAEDETNAQQNDTTDVVDMSFKVWDASQKDSVEYRWTGAAVNGQPVGSGRAVCADGRVYEGIVSGDHFEDSNCTFTLVNGDTYNGSFRNGGFNGVGTYRIKDGGNYFKGTFKNGAPVTGTWYNKDGTVLEVVK
ncbi:MAG: protein kinase [Bacteroidaceae bacterium]|nr:protein kinase [Bacteroidaceae bacterium]